MATAAGKTIVITGATSGIGFETAGQLARQGARLVLVGRDRAKGEAAVASLRRRAPSLDVQVFYADLSLLAEQRRLAAQLDEALPRIDVLINNAGAFFAKRIVTADGLELTFALNHMAYFVVTALLRDKLAASGSARIVNVSSDAHRRATLDFDDLQTAKNFSAWKAYGRSKLANILFTRELARRLAGTGVTANCLHPGFVASNFGDNNPGFWGAVIGLGKRVGAISLQDGAKTSVYLATSTDVATSSGVYFEKSRPATPTAAAQDDAAAARLWQASAKIAGLPP
jgi:NAD(P)-dependent dehydrogenase (short-subunit alcohol dehydrogenase family)